MGEKREMVRGRKREIKVHTCIYNSLCTRSIEAIPEDSGLFKAKKSLISDSSKPAPVSLNVYVYVHHYTVMDTGLKIQVYQDGEGDTGGIFP